MDGPVCWRSSLGSEVRPFRDRSWQVLRWDPLRPAPRAEPSGAPLAAGVPYSHGEGLLNQFITWDVPSSQIHFGPIKLKNGCGEICTGPCQRLALALQDATLGGRPSLPGTPAHSGSPEPVCAAARGNGPSEVCLGVRSPGGPDVSVRAFIRERQTDGRSTWNRRHGPREWRPERTSTAPGPLGPWTPRKTGRTVPGASGGSPARGAVVSDLCLPQLGESLFLSSQAPSLGEASWGPNGRQSCPDGLGLPKCRHVQLTSQGAGFANKAQRSLGRPGSPGQGRWLLPESRLGLRCTCGQGRALHGPPPSCDPGAPRRQQTQGERQQWDQGTGWASWWASGGRPRDDPQCCVLNWLVTVPPRV